MFKLILKLIQLLYQKLEKSKLQTAPLLKIWLLNQKIEQNILNNFFFYFARKLSLTSRNQFHSYFLDKNKKYLVEIPILLPIW